MKRHQIEENMVPRKNVNISIVSLSYHCVLPILRAKDAVVKSESADMSIPHLVETFTLVFLTLGINNEADHSADT